MIKVTVPASSANFGSGTDCVGVALPLYLEAEFTRADGFKLVYEGGADPAVSLDEDLIYISAREVCRASGLDLPGFGARIRSAIPLCSGLGSSAAAIVAGACGANALLGGPLGERQLANIVTAIEGHPDNVVPCLAGGFAVSMVSGGEVFYTAVRPGPELAFITASPSYRVSTKEARGVLPKEVPLDTAIRQLQRGCYLVSIMQSGDYGRLADATEDMIFTPARRGIIKGYDAVVSAAEKAGAYCAVISGAGPTIMALAHSGERCAGIADSMLAAFASVGLDAEAHVMSADNLGARVEEL